MSENDLRASFDRCEAAGDVGEVFYKYFLESSPEIAPLFAETNFKKQRVLLRGTVYIMVTRDPDDAQARATLERIGQSHSRSNLNIRPALYELWLESLCKTVKQLDAKWSPQLEATWRRRMQPGIDVITSMYERDADQKP